MSARWSLAASKHRIQDLTFINLGFAGNDSPSFVFPTAIATKATGGAAGGGGGGSGRPPVAQKPSYLTGGAGPAGHLSQKRGTEDLDFYIGDEAIAQANGPGKKLEIEIQGDGAGLGGRADVAWWGGRLWDSLSDSPWAD